MFVNRALLSYAGPARLSIALTVVTGLAASGAAVGVAFSLAATVATVLAAHDSGGGAGVDDISTPLLATAGFTLARVVFLWLRDQAATHTAVTVKRRLRRELMRQVFRLGPGQRWESGTGGVRATVVEGVESLQSYVGLYLPHLVVTLIVPLALVGIVASKDIWVALVIALGVAAVPMAQRIWDRLLGDRASVHWEAFARYAAKFTDSVQGIATLAAMGAAGRRAEVLAVEGQNLRRASNANLRASLGVSIVTTMAMSIGVAGATILAAFHAASGELSVADVLLVLFLAVECFRPLQELQGYWHEGFHGISAAMGISKIRDARPVVCDGDGVADIVAAPTIALESVWYRYPDTEHAALESVTCQIPAGSTLAVVGRSGAGKSTLVRLLSRDVDPSQGVVRVNGTDLRRFRLASVRRLSARVAQDIVLLDGTIRQNIRFARPDASEAEFTEAVTKARVDEFAPGLPGGYDNPVGEGGSLLSGGQRQRVALARALIARSPILILDEATSALDAENEAIITEAIQDDQTDRTTIIVAHRLSTVIHADNVLVLDQGRVVQFGSPADLAGVEGPWADLVAVHTGITDGVNR